MVILKYIRGLKYDRKEKHKQMCKTFYHHFSSMHLIFFLLLARMSHKYKPSKKAGQTKLSIIYSISGEHWIKENGMKLSYRNITYR